MLRPSSRVGTKEEAVMGVNTFMGLDKTDPCFCPFIRDFCKTNCLCYIKPKYIEHLYNAASVPPFAVHDSWCNYAEYVKGGSE